MEVQTRHDLENVNIIITGAARGLGAALALGLSDLGSNVILCGRALDALDVIAGHIEARTGRRPQCFAIDLADVPPRVLKTLPFTTWLRLQRIVEGSDTACLLVGPEPLARSAGGLTVMCTGRTTWSGASGADRARRFTGLDTEIRVVSPRRRVDGETRVAAVANDSQ